MLLDIHTHHLPDDPSVLAILNQHQCFGGPATGGYVSAGLHPWYLHPETLEADLNALEVYATSGKVLAVGECGLDKLTTTDWNLQIEAFERQIVLAGALQKPLIVHCVRAFHECTAMLKNVQVPVIFHGVNNRLSIVKPLIDAGFFLSFGRALLHPNTAVAEAFNAVPLAQLFLETDDTGARIHDIYKTAAQLRKIEEKEIVLQLELNFRDVFKP